MPIISGTQTQTFVSPGSDSTKVTPEQRDILLTKFSGETLASFNTKVVAKEYIRIRNVRGQKSAQFPAIGKATAGYHQPGEVIDGQTIRHGETTINIDDLLVSPVFVSNFLEAMTHFETRGEYARQMADSLAQAYDTKVFAMAVKACLDAMDNDALPEFGSAADVDLGTTFDVQTFVDAIYATQAKLDENDIPENDRVLFVPPTVYYALVNDGRFLNRDFGNDGNGSQADARILKVADLPLVKTNNLSRNHANAVKREGVTIADFDVDASNVKGLILQRQALGAVHLMDISTESEYKLERQGDLMISKMANGMGVLRPECLRTLSIKPV